MSMQSKAKQTGRPRGAVTADRDLVNVPPSRCQRCGCTERSPYHDVRRIEGNGTAPDGQPYTAVILRPTKCLNPDCGQHRNDRTWEYLADETGAAN